MKNLLLTMRRTVNRLSKMPKPLTSVLLLLFSFITLCAYGQGNLTVRGTVIDEDQNPLPGVRIVLKNTTTGTTTDSRGNFTLAVPDANQTLVFSYVGMETREMRATPGTAMRVAMNTISSQIDDVIVVGYGTQKKESVVGSIVQTTGETLERAGGVSNVGQALTGNLPGVTTISSTGMPGAEDPQIIIRAQSSWNNSDPLILVDGIERPLNTVDISSVATISVLKDASATAVFGVRGANGVILITTKRGNDGKADVRIGVNSTVKMVSKLPGKYDSYDALRIRNMAIENELGVKPTSWANITPQDIMNKYRYPANLEESERYPNIDWADELFKSHAMSYNANASVSGGTQFVKYFANVDYTQEGDMFKKYDNNRGYETGYGYSRFNVRSNLDLKLTKTTELRVGLAGSNAVTNSPWDQTYENSFWQSAYSTPPDIMMPRYSDGTWGYYPKDAVGITNSVQNLATSGRRTRTTDHIQTDFTLAQDLSAIVKGLKAKGTISWDNTYVENNRGINDLYNNMQSKWIDPATGLTEYKEKEIREFDFKEAIRWNTTGGAVDNGATYRKTFYQMQLDYARQFGDHSVTAMGLVIRNQSATGSNFLEYREDWVFRLTYDFRKKYLFEYNGSYNGSDKFAPEYRFAFFHSGAVGWTISEEKLLKKLKFLDMMKLRASYGGVGDDKIVTGHWLYVDQYAYSGAARLNLERTDSPYTWYRESGVGNPNVHWETIYKTNYGVDFSVLNGKISGSADFFHDKRIDVMMGGGTGPFSRSVPSYYGTVAPQANLGKVTTQGYELTLKFSHNFQKDLRFWAEGNMTHAKDKIINGDDPILYPGYMKKAEMQINQTTAYIDHGYYNTWDEVYGSTPIAANDNQKLPGGYHIIDYNGDGVIDDYDRVPYAYPERPQNTYNGTIGFDWKGFKAFVQFYGVNNVIRQVTFTDFASSRNIVYDHGTYWTNDNRNADIPMPRFQSTPDGRTNGTRYYYDGSYIRLKNVEISYTFDSGWVKKAGLKSLRLFVNGNNLWVWSKMPDDRESNYASGNTAYPTVKRINFGTNINF